MDEFFSDFERATQLQNLLVAHATALGKQDTEEYESLRKCFIDNPATKKLVPDFVRTNRNLDQFWGFIKHSHASYAERRKFIWAEFAPLLDALESGLSQPADLNISDGLKNLDTEEVQIIWHKALERRSTDPEGAITIAKSLLETTCKHILDKRNVEYDQYRVELPELYRLTAHELNLAPDQHTEETFKKILGGITSVVNELGSVRNRLGDAHGHGKRVIRPAARHAELAINLAGSITLFLVQTTNKEKDESKVD